MPPELCIANMLQCNNLCCTAATTCYLLSTGVSKQAGTEPNQLDHQQRRFPEQTLTNQSTKPIADLFMLAQTSHLPAQMQSLVQDGLSKTRDAALKSLLVVKDGADSISKANSFVPKESGAVTKKVFDHTTANIEAAFDAAEAITQAKSPVEVIQLQAQYMQAQFAMASEQIKELFELSTKAAQKSVEDFNGAVKNAATGGKV